MAKKVLVVDDEKLIDRDNFLYDSPGNITGRSREATRKRSQDFFGYGAERCVI